MVLVSLNGVCLTIICEVKLLFLSMESGGFEEGAVAVVPG